MFNFLKMFSKKNVQETNIQVSEEVQPIELLKASLKNYEQFKTEKEIRDEAKRRYDKKLLYYFWLGHIETILEKIDEKIIEKTEAVKNGEFVTNHLYVEFKFSVHDLYFYQMLKKDIEEKFGEDIKEIFVRYIYGFDYNNYPYVRKSLTTSVHIFLNLDGLKVNKPEDVFSQHNNIIHDFISIVVHDDNESDQWKTDKLNGSDIKTNITEKDFDFLKEISNV